MKAGLALVAFVLLGCNETPPPRSLEPPPPLSPISSQAPEERPDTAETEPASPAAETPASRKPGTPVDASPVRRPKVSSSPGEIECRNVVCDLATEICCQSHESGECVPRTEKAGCASVELLWKYCDESEDCEKGSVCCYAPRPDPSVYATSVCRKNDCTDPDFETCLAGGKCSRKRRCKVEDGAYDGYCH